MIANLIFALAVAGLAISLYFMFTYYGRVRNARWIPSVVCARPDSVCVKLVHTPYAHLLGVPNFLLGAFYYLALIWWTGADSPVGFEFLIEDRYRILRIAWLLILAGLASVAFSAFLVYVLHWKLKARCPLCYTAHAVNVCLLILLVIYAAS